MNVSVKFRSTSSTVCWLVLICLCFCAIPIAKATQDYDLNNLATSEGFTMTAGGSAVSAAGDVNGDGINDILIGAYWFNSYAGWAYVVFGKGVSITNDFSLSAFVTGPTTGFRIMGPAGGDLFGFSVSNAGDVNGDGVDDIIMGAHATDVAADRIEAGITYVIFGRRVTSAGNAFTDIQLSTSALPADVGFRILGARSYDYSGYSVSGAGDVNNDGVNDVIVGAFRADPPGLAVDSMAGMAYVVFGKNLTGTSQSFGDVNLTDIVTGSSLGFRILGAVPGGLCGISVSRAGDVNHDGISDVIVGATEARGGAGI